MAPPVIAGSVPVKLPFSRNPSLQNRPSVNHWRAGNAPSRNQASGKVPCNQQSAKVE